MRIWAASASKFLIKRRADFIGFTAAMLSDPESLSDPEVFVGFFHDTARPWQKPLTIRVYLQSRGDDPANLRVFFVR